MASKKASPVPGISFMRELGGIKEYKLEKNGLRILLAKDDSTPVAGCMVTYHVGSRNEATGYTGATHLLEHLLFEDMHRFNKKDGTYITDVLEAQGARINATTWLDRTNYYSVLPSDALPLAIEIEGDRMRGSLFCEQDKVEEMPIVRSEYEINENDPREALDKAVWSAAFVAHPYHHPTIGWKSDIENVSTERLRQFYDDFYWPDNATVTIAGNFNEAEALALIRKEFGRHPKKPAPYPALYTTEPAQQGQRRVQVERVGVDVMGISHKIPEATHADIPALIVLATILYDDKTSRLYKRFIDTALATEVLISCSQFRDPGLFQTFITLAPKTSHQKAEALLMAEYRNVQEKGVEAIELKRAKQSLRSYIASRRDGPYALLSSLNEDIATGDWTRFVTLPAALQAVTAADVKRVAKTYLADTQSTVGWSINTAK